MNTVKLPVDMDATPCVCGHPRWAHGHYRRGTDCGSCGRRACPWYQEPGALSWFDRFAIRFRSWLP